MFQYNINRGNYVEYQIGVIMTILVGGTEYLEADVSI